MAFRKRRRGRGRRRGGRKGKTKMSKQYFVSRGGVRM